MKDRMLVAALAAAVVGAPVAAQTTTPVTFIAWSSRVGHELDNRLHYPAAMMGRRPASGIVRVKFNCSDSGRPDKVSLFKTSGDRSLDAAALRAVSRIVSLHPLPDGLGHEQRYVATILFATSEEDYERQKAAIRAEAKQANGWIKGPAVIALADPDDRNG